MNNNQALHEVQRLGGAYFWDSDDEIEEIIEQILEHILTTSELTGLEFWKNRRNALQIVLAECSEKRLDQIVVDYYNLPLEYIGGRGHNLLERLYQAIAKAIQEREKISQSL